MEYIKLSEICDVRDGTHDSPKYVDDGFPLVTSKNILNGKLDLTVINYICQEDFDKINKRSKVDSGDIIMPMIGTIGNPLIVTDFCEFAIKNVALIKFPNDNISNKFIWYFLISPKFNKYITEKNKGGTQKFLSLGDVRNINVPKLDLTTQKCIVDKLDLVYSIIENRKTQLAKLDELIKSRFVEMFGDKWENPNNYNLDTLGNIYKFQYGKGNNIPEDKGDYFCYGSNGIVGHHTEYNSEDAPVIGHIGAYAGIVNWGKGKHYVTYNGVICKLKTNKVNPIYGYVLLQQQDFNRVAIKGGGQPFVSYSDLEAPKVVVPPIENQEEFAEFYKKVDKLKVEVQKSLDKTQILFDSLMQEYFG